MTKLNKDNLDTIVELYDDALQLLTDIDVAERHMYYTDEQFKALAEMYLDEHIDSLTMFKVSDGYEQDEVDEIVKEEFDKMKQECFNHVEWVKDMVAKHPKHKIELEQTLDQLRQLIGHPNDSPLMKVMRHTSDLILKE